MSAWWGQLPFMSQIGIIVCLVLFAKWFLFPWLLEANQRLWRQILQGGNKEQWLYFGWSILALMVLGLIGILLWKMPQWLTPAGPAAPGAGPPAAGAKSDIEAVKTLATIIGGAFLFIGMYLTWRRILATEKTVEVALEGQLTDRFTKAIAQLGDEKMAVRLGGIYALERIAWDSQRDHWPVMEVLTAFIRENAPWPPRDPKTAAPAGEVSQCLAIIASLVRPEAPASAADAGDTAAADQEPIPPPARDAEPALPSSAPPESDEAEIKPRTDVQAALTVIGRRKPEHRQTETNRLDLRAADLRGADLSGLNLEKARLHFANLRGAYLREANLHGAILLAANLQGASLPKANLQGASLLEANLQGARLWEANLQEAILSGANLLGAALREANLQKAHLQGANLQWADVLGANLQRAGLRGANLQWAALLGANLQGADVLGANLQGADLRGANLSGAQGLTRYQLRKAEIDEDTELPDYLLAEKENPPGPA